MTTDNYECTGDLHKSIPSLSNAGKTLFDETVELNGKHKKLAKDRSQFGNPSAFSSCMAQSCWESFTVTLKSPTFFDKMIQFSGNEAGTGGLVTLSATSDKPPALSEVADNTTLRRRCDPTGRRPAPVSAMSLIELTT